MNELDIFTAALAIDDSAERAACLERVCADRPDLKQRLVDLLAAQGRTHSPLDRPAGSPAAFAATSAFSDPDANSTSLPRSSNKEEVAGAVLGGRYKLVEEIGEGGMGTVWMAQQTEPVKRAVAIKLIKAGMDSKAVLARFEAERQALAIMDHPNIAKVLDAGAAPDGRPFFVMELVKGVPITDYCDQRKLTPRERLALFLPVCHAIQHAHQKGVIHRDIKPSNVLIAQYDDLPVPKVIDFGIAKAAGQSLTDRTLMTSFGAVVGTPEYMSPEQASFNQLDIDTRSDVYALGVLLYELLTGTPPLARKELEKAGLIEVLRVIREQKPPKPSTRLSTADALPSIAASRSMEPKKLTGLVRGELDWIVMKALEKDRNRRYESANGFAADVQRYLTGEQVQAVPPSVAYRLRTFARKNRAALLTGTALCGLLIVGVIGTTWGMFEAQGQRAAAEKSEQVALKLAASEADARLDAIRKAEDVRQANLKLHEEKFRTETQLQRAEKMVYANRLATAQRAWDDNQVALAFDHLNACRWDYRGWEHALLYARFHAGQAVLDDQRRPADARFSPDGKWIATAYGHTIRILDAATGQMVHSLQSADEILAICYSPDGKKLAVAGLGNMVRIWETSKWTEFRSLPADRQLNYIAFSPDGTRLAGCGFRSKTQVWNVETGTVVFANNSIGASLCYSPDGTRILAASSDSTARLLNASTGVEILKMWQRTSVRSVSFSPDGTRLATAGGNGQDSAVKIWDAASGREVRSLGPFRNEVRLVRYSPDGACVATAGGTPHGVEEIRVWEESTGRELFTLRGHTGQINSLCFSPTGNRLITSSDDYTIRIWDAVAGQALRALPIGATMYDGDTGNIAVSPNGKWIVAGMWSDVIPVWDVATGQRHLALKVENGPVRAVCFNHDSTLVAAAGGNATVWDARTGKLFREFKGFDKPVRTVAFSTDGKRLFAGTGFSGSPGAIHVWDVTTGQPLPPLAGHPSPVVAMCISTDGKILASVSEGGRLHGNSVISTPGELKVWDGVTGKELFSRVSHPKQILAVCFTPDGKRVITAGDDRTVRIWDAVSGDELSVLRGSSVGVRSLACSPDGKRIVSAGGEYNGRGEIKVWDAITGHDLLTLRGHSAKVTGLCFTPDGRRLFSAAGDNRQSIELWEWSDECGRQPLVLDGGSTRFHTVALTPDGSRVVGRSRTGKTVVFDLATGYRIDGESTDIVPTQPEAVSPEGTRRARIEVNTIRIEPLPEKPAPVTAVFLERLGRWAQPNPDWHAQQARDAERSKQWFTAVFHLRRLAGLTPVDGAITIRFANALDQLADLYEALNRSAEAKSLRAERAKLPPGAK